MIKTAYSLSTSLIAIAMIVVGFSATTAQAQTTEDVTINVMKHVCDVSIQSIDDFNSIDIDGDGVTEFTDKVLMCPTVVLPGDNYDNRAIHFPIKRDFNFRVTGDDGNSQTIADARLVNQKVCEPSEPNNPEANTVYLGADVNGDGRLNACIDTSFYSYTNVAAGDITVAETVKVSPTKTGGALEFTPASLNDRFDESRTLNDSNRFRDGVVRLDSTRDNDGVVTLHIYNFQMTDQELSYLLGVAKTELINLLSLLQSQYIPGFPNTGDGSIRTI